MFKYYIIFAYLYYNLKSQPIFITADLINQNMVSLFTTFLENTKQL